jgi:hypothetical protein
MKQTAVEWLFEQLDISQGYESAIEIFQQAKEMEKDQIINAWIATDNELQRIAAEQYYNETFKSK